MVKKYAVFIGIIISIALLYVSTLYYPGGSQQDMYSIGYDWKNNYISNLFGETAINGSRSGSLPWAAGGMFFIAISFALFFIKFSKKIPDKTASRIIKYFGTCAMLFAFLAVTPYHDTMIRIADPLALLSMFYITAFTFKARLYFSMVLSVLSLFSVYCGTYIYYTGSFLAILPIVQKSSLAINMAWVLWLEYFTKSEDFQHPGKDKTGRQLHKD